MSERFEVQAAQFALENKGFVRLHCGFSYETGMPVKFTERWVLPGHPDDGPEVRLIWFGSDRYLADHSPVLEALMALS